MHPHGADFRLVPEPSPVTRLLVAGAVGVTLLVVTPAVITVAAAVDLGRAMKQLGGGGRRA